MQLKRNHLKVLGDDTARSPRSLNRIYTIVVIKHLVPAASQALVHRCNPGFTCLQGLTALHMAAHQGHSSIAAQLCRMAGVEVDAVDHAGCTPLHHATALGHDAVVMELWSKSANVDIADANGWTGNIAHWLALCTDVFKATAITRATLLATWGQASTAAGIRPI